MVSIDEIRARWQCDDVSPEELRQRLRLLIEREDYKKTTGRGDGGKAWLFEKAVEAYEDIPYLLSELERTQAEMAAEREANSCKNCPGFAYVVAHDGPVGPEKEAQNA